MELLTNALLNTVVGMGTVFVVLIFISFIISLLRYVPSLVQKFTKQPTPVVVPQKSEVVVPMQEEEQEELVDDTELVAVITAAIMAAMGAEAPKDGLVVRSIRKVNRPNWKNA